MKKIEVETGKVYRVKVSGNLVDVRITGENPRGGWDGVNLATKRKIRVRSPQRLRAVAQPRPTKRKTIMSLAEYEAKADQKRGGRTDAAQPADGAAETVAVVEAGNLVDGVTVPTGRKHLSARASEKRGRITDADNANVAPSASKPGKATKDATPAEGGDTGERGAKGAKRTSGLDAAAQVLGEAGEPLNTKEMVDRMLAEGLWQTSGRTPASTIYAAILRECTSKGDASRFRKVARGKFELSR